jgi:hypothetical protein
MRASGCRAVRASASVCNCGPVWEFCYALRGRTRLDLSAWGDHKGSRNPPPRRLGRLFSWPARFRAAQLSSARPLLVQPLLVDGGAILMRAVTSDARLSYAPTEGSGVGGPNQVNEWLTTGLAPRRETPLSPVRRNRAGLFSARPSVAPVRVSRGALERADTQRAPPLVPYRTMALAPRLHRSAWNAEPDRACSVSQREQATASRRAPGTRRRVG